MATSPFDKKSYKLAGLRIVSDLSLSQLPICDDLDSDAIVTIRHAPVREVLSDNSPMRNGAAYDGKSLLLAIPQVAHYLIHEGSEILIEPERSADGNDVRAFLLGSAFGSLCHQRGMVPLHSAAIDVQDGCVAFIGHSGAGKSTLAAALALRGHQVIADDVTFLSADRDGNLRGWPGIGQVRLWEDALAPLGYNTSGIEQEFRGYNKYLLPVSPPRDRFASRRLRRIYHLTAAKSGSRAAVNQVFGATAAELLMPNVYRPDLAACMGRALATFSLCAALLRQVPMFRFSRPRGFEMLREGVDLLEEHLSDLT